MESQFKEFDRFDTNPDQVFKLIGSGEIGGKALGLALLDTIIGPGQEPAAQFGIPVGIPQLTVICTDVFDEFMHQNNLLDIALSESSDGRIAHAFQLADLPFRVLGDLQTLIGETTTPLAIRSSSLLEDAVHQPFAGIYATKMIPNHQFEPAERFQKLSEAIKFVYASTYFHSAISYRNATGQEHTEEKMAVIIQDVVGKSHGLRFYPEISGVARSYNFYPIGRAEPEDGVVNLALGLGKTIVDGGVSWVYSPAYPKVGPPFGSTKELLNGTQKQFWAINMGTPLVYDPVRETEYLVKEDLATAEQDGTLRKLCSTYDAQSDRMRMGLANPGPRVLDFAPLLSLREIAFNDTIKEVLATCERETNCPVEIEFACTLNPLYLGLVQVRPMVVSSEAVEISEEEFTDSKTVIASEKVLGNGIQDQISDIVYLIPEKFDIRKTKQMAAELSEINQKLIQEDRPYLLIVFGRLGSSDPWLGIPVNWGEISGTKVIVETYQDDFSADMSQGSHFFHNMTNLQVSYFSVPKSGRHRIKWDWLRNQAKIEETQFFQHVQADKPMIIKIDGRAGVGLIQSR